MRGLVESRSVDVNRAEHSKISTRDTERDATVEKDSLKEAAVSKVE